MKKIDGVKHKRRWDRGGQYMNYYSPIALSLVLIKSFKVNDWWWYVLIIIAVIAGRYLFGWWDDVHILKKEQDQYAKNNPFLRDLVSRLDRIEKAIKQKNKAA